jgi:23S rRNA (uridine2552-2'-O)-methyltransferase
MQYIAERIGPEGRLVGVDIDALEIALPPHATSVVGDVDKLTTAEVLLDLPAFDLVLSDMAPNTTGDSPTDVWRQEELWLSAHTMATKVLRVGGHFAAKAFQGQRFPLLLETLKAHFQEARAYRCKETRSGSREQYLIGRVLRPTKPLLP